MMKNHYLVEKMTNKTVITIEEGWQIINYHVEQKFCSMFDGSKDLISPEVLSLLYSFSYKLSKQNNNLDLSVTMKIELERCLHYNVRRYFVEMFCCEIEMGLLKVI